MFLVTGSRCCVALFGVSIEKTLGVQQCRCQYESSFECELHTRVSIFMSGLKAR